MFQGADLHDAMGVPFFYGVCEAVMVGTYCVVCWKAGWSKAPSDVPIWRAIFTTYEVVAAHGDESLEGIEVAYEPKLKEDEEEGHVQMGNFNNEKISPTGDPEREETAYIKMPDDSVQKSATVF